MHSQRQTFHFDATVLTPTEAEIKLKEALRQLPNVCLVGLESFAELATALVRHQAAENTLEQAATDLLQAKSALRKTLGSGLRPGPIPGRQIPQRRGQRDRARRPQYPAPNTR